MKPRLPVCSRTDGPNPCDEVHRNLDAVFTFVTAGDLDDPRAPHELHRDAELLLVSPKLEKLYERLGSELDFSVATNARAVIFVHAGVVGWRGRAVLLPGRSMAGKTSLVAALLRAGADYYSDEYAVVDSAGLIHPYPRPLGVRGPDGDVRQVSPETLASRVGTHPIRASLVIATRHVPGARFEPTEPTATRALLSLIDNTVVVRERSRFALDCLTPVARDAKMLEGDRGEADDAAARILEYLDAANRAVEPRESLQVTQ